MSKRRCSSVWLMTALVMGLGGAPVVEARAHGRLMAEVPGERHGPHAAVVVRELQDLHPAPVRASVVDHDDLGGEPALVLDAIGETGERAV